MAMKRSRRGQVAKLLMANELQHMTFVIERDAVLSQWEKGNCSLSDKRKKFILNMHNSLEQIKSYPSGVCIDVGYMFALDVVKYQLREEVNQENKRTKAALSETLESALPMKAPETVINNKRAREDSLDALMSSSGLGMISGLHFHSLPDTEATVVPTESELEDLLQSPLPNEEEIPPNTPKKQRRNHNHANLLQMRFHRENRGCTCLDDHTAPFSAEEPLPFSNRSIAYSNAFRSMDIMDTNAPSSKVFHSMEFLDEELKEEDVVDALAIMGRDGDFNPMRSIDGFIQEG